MSDLIDAVIKTRKISAEIAAQSLLGAENISELEIHDLVLSKMASRDDIFPKGWYDPPPGGVSVIFDEAPFKRLQYDSLRNPEYWSNKTNVFTKEAVGSVYFSTVDKKTRMMGDIGFTMYSGNNGEIRQHLKNVYEVIFTIAKHAAVGMKFSELCSFARKLFENKFKPTRWVTISSDPNQSMNLGHSVTGSFESNFNFGDTFEEVKEALRTKRVALIDTENFEIPETCAFIVESRLEDFNKPHLPSAYFQFIVCFDKGKKTIMDNFNKIFSTVGMEYMQVI